MELAVDPEGVEKARMNKDKNFVMRAVTEIINFVLHTLVSLLAFFILALYFIAFFFLFWKRKLYDELWQAMANQYQELPEDRLFKADLTERRREFWEALDFSSKHLSSINGIRVNGMFEVKKLTGEMDSNEYTQDAHLIEVHGRYRMKKWPFLYMKKVGELTKKYPELNTLPLENVDYPDMIETGKQDPITGKWVDIPVNRTDIGLTSIQNPDERKMIIDAAKVGVSMKKPVMYPFIINLPMEPSKGDTFRMPGTSNEILMERQWFYFEVEIVKRSHGSIPFIVGMLPAPYGEVTHYKALVESIDENFVIVDPESKNCPEKLGDKFFTKSDIKQPEWITNYLRNASKGAIIAEGGVQYLSEWKNIIPGELPDSIGFDVSNGKFKKSGGLEWAIDLDDWMKQIYEPDNLWKTREKKKTMAEKDEELTKKLEQDEEGAHYVGDSFGIAYNVKSGFIYLTYNGTVINKPSDHINTMVNMAILKNFDEAEEKFNLEKEQKAMVHPKYFNKLNLDAQVKKELDPREMIKINTGIKYIPTIYSDQNTKFRVNFGASPFRNQQPDFQPGLLIDYDASEHYYLHETIDVQAPQRPPSLRLNK